MHYPFVTRSLLALSLAAVSLPAAAEIYLTGSGSFSTSNVPLQTYKSSSASGSLAFDLGRYIRLGYTYRDELKVQDGYEIYDDPLTPQIETITSKTYSRTDIISHSIDLTLILYEGDTIVPYLTGGGVWKAYFFETRREFPGGEGPTETSKIRQPVQGPLPNLGAGIGIRLSRAFSLKLSGVASPGVVQTPDGLKKSVWDKYSSIGLTVQL